MIRTGFSRAGGVPAAPACVAPGTVTQASTIHHVPIVSSSRGAARLPDTVRSPLLGDFQDRAVLNTLNHATYRERCHRTRGAGVIRGRDVVRGYPEHRSPTLPAVR